MSAKVVGNYKIIEKIGEGGMGAVYKGVDLMLEREVAIKALRPELASQPHLVERFRAEAITLAKLNHPNIATLHSFFRQGEEFFMVMEFVRGETLDQVLRRAGGMNCNTAISLFCQALDGIDHAHRLGIVHRDIKPANMMLTESGSIKVMDFGIARVLGTARMTKQGNVIGTIEYMSPEQVRGKETDSRSDIYSLGILLYEMLTGRVPFNSDSEYELMRSQIEDPPTPPRDFAPHIPLPVEEAIMRALAKRPDARFQTAGEFRKALLAGFKPVSAPLDTKRLIRPASGVSQDRPIAAPGEVTRELGSAPEPRVEVGTADHMRASLTDVGADSRPTALSAETPAPKETRMEAPEARDAVPPTVIAPPQAAPAGPNPGPVSPGIASHGAVSPEQVRSASLFEKLTWKHYAIAAAAIFVVFIGGVALIASVVSHGSVQHPASAVQNSAISPQSQSQQLQPELLPQPASAQSPSLAVPDQSQPVGSSLTSDQATKPAVGSTLKNRQANATDNTGDATAPVTAPGAAGAAPPAQAAGTTPDTTAGANHGTAQNTTATHATGAAAKNPPAGQSQGGKSAQAADSAKPEKKRGIFSKIKDKVEQPFKKDSDKKDQQ